MMTHIKTVLTASLANELHIIHQAQMIRESLAVLRGDVEFLVFDPEATERSTEDGGRTARIPAKGLMEKCYAQIDDHGGDTGKVLTIYKASER